MAKTEETVKGTWKTMVVNEETVRAGNLPQPLEALVSEETDMPTLQESWHILIFIELSFIILLPN
jgi:hypothetical protein